MPEAVRADFMAIGSNVSDELRVFPRYPTQHKERGPDPVLI